MKLLHTFPIQMLCLSFIIFWTSFTQSQTKAFSITLTKSDTLAIISASMDYVQGWYEGSVERMERSLHPDLVKRSVKQIKKTNKSYLNHLSKSNMIELTSSGGGKNVPKEKLFYEAKILDIYKEIATVKGVSTNYIDYIHLAKWNGQWMIINILWSKREQ